MPVTDIFKINKIKDELERVKKENDELKTTLAETERMDYYQIKEAIKSLEDKKNRICNEISSLETSYDQKKHELDHKINDLNIQIANKQAQLVITA